MMRPASSPGRLGLRHDPRGRQALAETRQEDPQSAAAARHEELLDPLRRGWGADNLPPLVGDGPPAGDPADLDREVAGRAPGASLFWKMLAETDRRRAGGEVLSDAILLGVVFLPLSSRRSAGGGRPVDAQASCCPPRGRRQPVLRAALPPNAAITTFKQGSHDGRLGRAPPGDPAHGGW